MFPLRQEGPRAPNTPVGQAGPQGAERTPWEPRCRESAMITAACQPTPANATCIGGIPHGKERLQGF
jgi:hypothetical protein